MKVTATFWFPFITTVQLVPEVLLQPLQLPKMKPEAAVAERVTVLPPAKGALQAVAPAPQLMPAGVLATVPLPVTVTCNSGCWAKEAVTAWLEFKVSVQVLAPVQAPLQPVKTQVPSVGAWAVRVTCVPPENEAEQAVGQLMPAGLLWMAPVPFTVTERVNGPACCGAKLAVTAWLLFIRMVQAPEPEQAPLQPVKVKPAAGAALKATLEPAEKPALHVVPQLTPAGLLVTLPLPERVTARVKVESPPLPVGGGVLAAPPQPVRAAISNRITGKESD